MQNFRCLIEAVKSKIFLAFNGSSSSFFLSPLISATNDEEVQKKKKKNLKAEKCK